MKVIHVVTFYLRCMVSEIKMFHYQLDMTSSSVLRHGMLHTLFHGGFWKSDHDFKLMIHSNFLSGMHGFRDNEVLLPTGYNVIMISPLGGVSGEFSWRILTEWPWLPHSSCIVIFYLGCMVTEITRFYCQPEMTSSCDFSARGISHMFCL